MTRSTTKFSIRRLIVPIAAVLAGIVTACSSDSLPVSQSLAPADQASFQSTPAPQPTKTVQGLLRRTPRHITLSVTRTIHKEGGTIDFPGTGMQLQIPRGALSGDMTFTIYALAGNVVAYDFAPHGAVFPVPLILTQDLDETDFEGIRLPAGFTPKWAGAYFTNSRLVDERTGISTVQEIIPASTAWSWRGHRKSGRVSFPISHFSGYMISTGEDAF